MDRVIDSFMQSVGLNITDAYYVNLPPGILRAAILSGGFSHTAPEYPTDQNPGLLLTDTPDTYSAVGRANLDALAAKGLACRYQIYTKNQLSFMVPASSPMAGKTLTAAEFYDYYLDPTTTISEALAPGQGIGTHFLRMYAEVSQEIHPSLQYDRECLDAARSGTSTDQLNFYPLSTIGTCVRLSTTLKPLEALPRSRILTELSPRLSTQRARP